MSDTVVFVVTHGDKELGPNPKMTPKGFEEVARLRSLLPISPSEVVCGTGQRHSDVADALGLTPTRFTTVVGGADSLDVIEGQKKVVLPTGRVVERKQYTTVEDTIPAAKALIVALPHATVVCSGRPLMIMLGKPDAESATIYGVTCRANEIIEIMTMKVNIQGESEEGTV